MKASAIFMGLGKEQYFGTIKLPLPDGETVNLEKRVPRASKTALYVPADRLEGCGFQFAKSFPDLLTTHNVLPILCRVADFGEVAPRYGDGETLGLEDDPTRKQVILYAAIQANDHLLWYQRAGSPNVPQIPSDQLGDERLLGKYSVGFGGHKTAEDIVLTPAEQLMLTHLVPGLNRFLERALGTSRGLFAEVEEELSLKQHDISRVNLLGAFMDNRITNPEDKIQVGQVHLCLPALIELDPESIDELRFDLREVARVWWVPRGNTQETLESYQAIPGVTVESWTEIMIREFLS